MVRKFQNSREKRKTRKIGFRGVSLANFLNLDFCSETSRREISPRTPGMPQLPVGCGLPSQPVDTRENQFLGRLGGSKAKCAISEIAFLRPLSRSIGGFGGQNGHKHRKVALKVR